MSTYAEIPPAPAVERQHPRTTSGKTLFLVTLGVVVLGVVLAVVAGVAGIVWLGLVVPAAYFVYLVVLLFFAGRAISYRNRPGEAATSILLAVLLSPAIAITPGIAIGSAALTGSGGFGDMGGLSSLFGAGTAMDGLGGAGDYEDETSGDFGATSEDYPLPPEAGDDVSMSEYQRYQDCMADPDTTYEACTDIVS